MYRRILQLAGHSAVYGLGSVASKLIAIALLPIVIRYLEPKSYGIAEAVLMIDLFAAALFRLGLQNAMMRFYYDAPADERDDVGVRVVRTTLALTLASLLVGVLVLWLLDRQLASFFLNNPERDEYIWIAAFGMWTSVVYSTITATFRLQKRPRAFLGISLGNVFLSAFLTLLFVTEFKWGVRGLLMANFLGYLGMVPFAGLMQRRYMRPVVDRALVRPMLRFALPTIPIAVAFQALTMIDRTTISRVAGLDDLGIYGLAARFAAVVLIVVTALQLSWQPFAYSITDDDEARRSYAIVTSWFAAVMGWLVSGMALLAEPVVRAMTVPAYYGAATLVPLLALAAGIYGAYFLVGIGASRVKRTGWHAAVAFGAVLVSLASNVLLVPEYGAKGAAISAVLANGALVAFMLTRSQRVFRVHYEWRLLQPLVLVGAAIATAYALPAGDAASDWLVRLALALSWPLVLLLTGFATAPERARIRRLVLRRGGGNDDPGAAPA